jgi:hypothetical protein
MSAWRSATMTVWHRLSLAAFSSDERRERLARLNEAQHGFCFIRQEPMDLDVHADSLDVDHVSR